MFHNIILHGIPAVLYPHLPNVYHIGYVQNTCNMHVSDM